ncbi:hypothetical protein FIU94_18750 (plasmid) [Sulfitobacter sp. THAF37]|nr:hypothetical protein FIU94_18750 [Sulfitobacter sp. THAF37]
MVMPEGVYLAHLKYASIDALADANAHRSEIASGKENGLPGSAWLHADKDAMKFFDMFQKAAMTEWSAAKAQAYAAIANDPVRDETQKVLRARSATFDSRTVLPEWFKYC